MKTLISGASAMLLVVFALSPSAYADPTGMDHSSMRQGHMSGDHMDDMMGDTMPHHDDEKIGRPGKAADAKRSLTIIMKDNYFEPEAITVKKGETVKFIIKNEGTLVHEFSLGTAEMHAHHAREMQMMVDHGVINGDRIDQSAMMMDMGNGQTMKHDDPNAVLLEPGKKAELVWTFSGDATLEFSCGVPGHAESGMTGAITSQE